MARVARELRQDLTAAQERDPAARGLGRGNGACVIPRGRAAARLGADLFGRRLALAAAVQAAASVMSLLVRYRRPFSSRRW